MWMYILIIFIVMLVSAFFSVADTSIAIHNKIRMRKKAQEGDPRAKMVVNLIEQYDKTVTTISITDNVLGVAASSMGAIMFTSLFGGTGVLVNTITFTILYLIVDTFPSTLASAKADNLALRVARPMRILCVLVTPLSFVFLLLQAKVRRWASESEEEAPSITEEELIHLIEEEGVLEEHKSYLVQSALEFDEVPLRDVVTPRVNLQALDINANQKEVARFLLAAEFSRVPVYEDSVDKIVGVLVIQQAMRALAFNQEIDVRALMVEPYFVHKGMKLSDLLGVFESKKIKMAIVLDEYGGTMGIITPIDLLEELVGDIYHGEPDDLITLDDGSYLIAGGYYLWSMFEKLEMDADGVESDYSTLNGWAMSMIGHIPKTGESFVFNDHRFAVEAMDGNKIARMSIKREVDNSPTDSQTS